MSEELLVVILEGREDATIDFSAGFDHIDHMEEEEFSSDFIEWVGSGDDSTVEDFRDALAEQLDIVDLAIKQQSPDLSIWETERGQTLYIAGGYTSGDPPSELFDAMCNLWAHRELLRAVGFHA